MLFPFLVKAAASLSPSGVCLFHAGGWIFWGFLDYCLCPVTLDESSSGLVVLCFCRVPLQAHLVVGNLVEPGLFGESFELSPVVVLLSLAFWGSLWVSLAACFSGWRLFPSRVMFDVRVCSTASPPPTVIHTSITK